MSLEKILSDLSPQQKNLDLVKETAAQIQKDFDAFGYKISFSENSEKAYQELFDQILPLIEHLMVKDYKKLLSVLYRIDVNESHINKEAEENSPQHFAEKLTEMILEREFKKVVIRNYFKNQQNER